jgi:hypothetical protein
VQVATRRGRLPSTACWAALFGVVRSVSTETDLTSRVGYTRIVLELVRRWWGERQKRAALRQYVRRLGLALAHAYGREETYSVGRIRTTLKRVGLSHTFERHALAMFTTKADFVAALQLAETIENRQELYEILRREVATLVNHGSYRFMPKHWEDIGMDNGDNAKAASRWGVGL